MQIKLHRIQDDFVFCPDRFSGFVGGIGSGKTFAGAVKSLIALDRGGLGLILAPTYPMLRDATLRTFLELAGRQVKTFHKSETRAEMSNGAEVLFRSSDEPDRLRGPNLDWAWLDECALMHAQTWDIIIGRLRGHGKAGPCWVTTTPKGRNWLFTRQGEMTVFKARTRDNIYLDEEFIRSLESAYTGSFARQELEGEFVSYEGLVYEEFNRDIHMLQRERSEFMEYIAGVDEGYSNPAVIGVWGIDSDGRMHMSEEFYQRRVLQGDVVGEAKRLQVKYGIGTFVVDPSAAGLIAEMQSVGLAVTPARNAVFQGIQTVKARLARARDGRPRLTIAPSCVNAAAEFESYAWKEGKDGMKDEPEKVNDHAMDMMRYAVMYLDAGLTGSLMA